MKTILKSTLVILTMCLIQYSFAQEVPFQEEVNNRAKEIDAAGWEPGGVVFTGSSSIRMWKTLQEQFPDIPIINSAFGGSQADQLLMHLEQTVLRFEPSKVFIYEGDNDINAGQEVSAIMKNLDELVTQIQDKNPETIVNLIAAKPSPSRWDKKTSYLALNDLMRQYATTHDQVNFVNIWDVMLDASGKPMEDIFIEDELHMNEKGYEIWKKSFTPFLR
ncbi:GDSL-type esterase/lipase family protein [Algoriphagus halophytocola]|uniref:GDSL-type esterase/lipase family protein n=1 Tax=Algoriphagus halophytocola TaxID=2991499 RepID=A0ABY6MGE1_9BACT|nr:MULTISPECIES: GDSL-type esterase/lipase family protein [unclassified Algoriphagus]UZD22519.1 GDSL-type esterase/lipase family protein [Algoriphagus sp. TR-M5]WBL43782.1 GDSL-type esterase/lipase family protein [Algoriphagus sp. TR-M9]